MIETILGGVLCLGLPGEQGKAQGAPPGEAGFGRGWRQEA
jgi:hypothetical protein